MTPANNGMIHYADVDGISVTVAYRPPLQPRPLRGCTTTRTQFYPRDIEGTPTAVAGTNISGGATQYGWYGGTPWGGAKQLDGSVQGHDWLDSDWGATSLSTGNTPFQGDQAFGDFGAAGGGNGGVGDTSDCPFLKAYSANGNSGVSTKFHVDGMIYAPSGAVELAGNDNDAAFASDGIFVRHLTALRWKNNGSTPFAGGRGTLRKSSLRSA